MNDRGASSGVMPGEVVVPLPPRSIVASEIRGAVVFSSQEALKRRDLFDRYMAELDPKHLPSLEVPGAQSWLPIEVGVEHYRACETLRIPRDEVYAIGREVEQKVQRGVVSIVAKVARSAGATPWTVLRQAPRLWSRIFKGSDVGVSRIAEHKAYFRVQGWPLAPNAYLHVGVAGVLAGFVSPFCNSSDAYLVQSDALSVAWCLSWS